MTEYEKDRCIARAERLEAICKALRCMAYTKDDFSCYADLYNNRHFNAGHKTMMVCGEQEGSICCPYYQDKYGTCYSEGECAEFLEEAANIIEDLLRFS